MDIVWHGYHNALISVLSSLAGRIADIIERKPTCEHKLRLRLIKLVKGRLPTEVIKTGDAYSKAWDARDKARDACGKAWATYDKAWDACGKARDAWKKAYQANLPVIEALHKLECPDCPYDGKTIFPDKGD